MCDALDATAPPAAKTPHPITVRLMVGSLCSPLTFSFSSPRHARPETKVLNEILNDVFCAARDVLPRSRKPTFGTSSTSAPRVNRKSAGTSRSLRGLSKTHCRLSGSIVTSMRETEARS